MKQASAWKLKGSRAHAAFWKCHTNGGNDSAREEESTGNVPAAAERVILVWDDTSPDGLCNCLQRHKE